MIARAVGRAATHLALLGAAGCGLLVGSAFDVTLAGDAGPDAAASDGAPPDAVPADAPVAADAAPSAYAAAVLHDTPLAYLRLGELAGGVARDQRDAFNGTYGGAVALGAPGAIIGDPDTAARLADASFVQVGDAFAFPSPSAFTIELWVKPMSLDAPTCLVCRRTDDGRDGYDLIASASGLDAHVYAFGAEVGGAATSAPLAVGAYSHVVVTFEGSTMTLFVNGAVVGSGSPTSGLAGASAAFTVGARSPAGGDVLDGVVDELAVYDHALSPARVVAHYAASGR